MFLLFNVYCLLFLVRSYAARLHALVVWVGVVPVLGSRLVGDVHGAELLCGVTDGTACKVELTVAREQRCCRLIVVEAAVGEDRIRAMALDERELAVVEEVALLKLGRLDIVEHHDAVGAVVDVRAVHREVAGVLKIETVGAAAVEVAIVDADAPAALDADDAALTVAALGVADGEVVNLNLLTVLEVQAEGIARSDDDARMSLAANRHPLMVAPCLFWAA